MPRVRAVTAACLIALSMSLALAAGCKAKVGDRCKGKTKTCQDGKSMLVCSEGTLQVAACKGPKGCVANGEDDATCDYSANVAGDPCPGFRGFRLCTADGKGALACPADKWEVESCKGPKACTMGPDGAFCDRSRGDEGDACTSFKPRLCTVDEKWELACDEKAGKFVKNRRCSGPHGCATDAGPVVCDDEGPHEAGERCASSSATVCSADGAQLMECVKGKYAAKDCPGMHGCKNRICDQGTAFEGMGCEDKDLACSEDGKLRLACKKKKAKNADGDAIDSWEFTKDKECPGGCKAKAGKIECG